MSHELKEFREKLHAMTTCSICGLPMKHDRLRGYVCHFERHNEERRAIEAEMIIHYAKDPKGSKR